MRISDKLCKSMNKINEDVVCYGKDYAFVIDGQSNLSEEGSQVTKWYVTNLKKEIKKNIYKLKLLDALNTAIKNNILLFKNTFPNVETPSATACIVRENNGKVEILIVGNPKCIVQTKKIELVEDIRMDLVEGNLLKKMLKYKKEQNINMLEARMKIQDALAECRKKVNTMGSYPAIKDKPLDITDITYKEYNYNDVVSAIICTDGFYAYKTYLMIKDKDLYDVVNSNGFKYCYNHIRRMESKDLGLNGFPRLKKYDDASALYLRFY